MNYEVAQVVTSTEETRLERIISRAFLTAHLLTANIEQAENALVGAIDSWNPDRDRRRPGPGGAACSCPSCQFNFLESIGPERVAHTHGTKANPAPTREASALLRAADAGGVVKRRVCSNPAFRLAPGGALHLRCAPSSPAHFRTNHHSPAILRLHRRVAERAGLLTHRLLYRSVLPDRDPY